VDVFVTVSVGVWVGVSVTVPVTVKVIVGVIESVGVKVGLTTVIVAPLTGAPNTFKGLPETKPIPCTPAPSTIAVV
jgi:hypothetical protein